MRKISYLLLAIFLQFTIFTRAYEEIILQIIPSSSLTARAYSDLGIVSPIPYSVQEEKPVVQESPVPTAIPVVEPAYDLPDGVVEGNSVVQIIIEEFETLGKTQVENALRVAKCESGYNPGAVGINTDGSRDRGIFQWNEKWNSHITDAQAFDPRTASRLAAAKVGAEGWWPWKSSYKCHGVE